MSEQPVGASGAEETTGIAVPVESPLASIEAAQGAKFISPGQKLMDRYKAQFDRLMSIRKRVRSLRADVAGGPIVPDSPPAENAEAVKPVAFFGGLVMIADSNDVALKAIEDELKLVEELF